MQCNAKSLRVILTTGKILSNVIVPMPKELLLSEEEKKRFLPKNLLELLNLNDDEITLIPVSSNSFDPAWSV